MITTTTAAAITSKQFEMEVKEGLVFILNHLDGLWPRMISTYATKGGQRLSIVSRIMSVFLPNFMNR
ncbi:MAG: hypothetical protein WBZ36_13690 [Candidatus Nitrosopolaris sp.]